MGENKDDEIKKLIKELNYHSLLYENGQEVISDKEWDDMYFKLQALENETGIYYRDSPTQNINYQVVNKLEKVEHDHPMLSLDKTKDMNVIKSFISNKDYIAMAKMDGLTCSLTYEDGRLVKAETRGNGVIGEDILHNALQIKNIPNKIDFKNKLVIDGEVICTYDNFKYFENEYKNPRNFASGSIRLLDSEESAKRNLSFIAWDCVEGLNCEMLSDKLFELHTLDFTTVPTAPSYESLEEKISCIKEWSKNLGYPIDGIVFKYNKCSEYNAAGRTDHHYRGRIGFQVLR